MNLKSRKTVFITGLCLASLIGGIPLSSTSVRAAEMMQQQSIKVKGQVVDSSGEPIIGANVVQKGTTNGTITDIDGNFTLDVSPKAILQISFIGYKSQDVTLKSGQTQVAIILKDDTELLDEVVVIGYGTMKNVI